MGYEKWIRSLDNYSGVYCGFLNPYGLISGNIRVVVGGNGNENGEVLESKVDNGMGKHDRHATLVA